MKNTETPREDVSQLLLPHERREAAPRSAEESLFDVLGADPEYREEATPPEDEPPADADDENAEDDELEADANDEDAADDGDADDDADSDDSDDETPETSTIELKVDGKVQRVTLEELKKGYSTGTAATRRFQEAAELRKAAEAEIVAARQSREQYGQKLMMLEEALKESAPAEPDWAALRSSNPAEFAAQWAEHQQRQARIAAVNAERQKIAHEHQAEVATVHQHVREEQRAKLLELIPEWADETKRADGQRKLVDYASSAYGYTEQDLGSVYDARLVAILDKARRYDELMTKGKTVVRDKAKKPAATLRPGGRDVPESGKSKRNRRALRIAREKVAQTGRVADAAAALMAMDDF